MKRLKGFKSLSPVENHETTLGGLTSRRSPKLSGPRMDRDVLGAATEGGAGAERELARRYSFFGVVL